MSVCGVCVVCGVCGVYAVYLKEYESGRSMGGRGVSSCGADPLCGAAPSRGEKTLACIVFVTTN